MRRTWIEGFQEQSAEEKIQAQKGEINMTQEESDNEKFYDLYSTLKVWVMAQGGWQGQYDVASMGEGRNAYRFGWEAWRKEITGKAYS